MFDDASIFNYACTVSRLAKHDIARRRHYYALKHAALSMLILQSQEPATWLSWQLQPDGHVELLVNGLHVSTFSRLTREAQAVVIFRIGSAAAFLDRVRSRSAAAPAALPRATMNMPLATRCA